MSIPSKQRTCKGYNKECTNSFVSNSTLCPSCRQAKSNDLKKASQEKSKAKKQEKLPLSEVEIEAMKGTNFKPKSSKRVRSQEELDKIKSDKAKLKLEKQKAQLKKKREDRKYSKESLLRDIQKLVRLTQPLHCFICKEPYQGNRVANGSHLLSRQYSATCYYAGNLSSGCNYCNNNTRTSGEQFFHSLEMDKLYGKGHSETIFRMGKIGYKWSKPELVELRELVDKYLNLVSKIDNISNKQQLWLDFKDEQEQMDFFKHLQKELYK